MDDKRYKTYKWQKLREQIILRDNHECQWCRAKGKVGKADVVHHIKEADDFPKLFHEPGNLITLCRDCHERHHGRLGLMSEMDRRFPERW